VLILHDTPHEGALVVEKRIMDQFYKNRFAAGKKTSKTNLSLGIAAYPDEGTTGETLIEKVMV